jgi:hypothetical protein
MRSPSLAWVIGGAACVAACAPTVVLAACVGVVAGAAYAAFAWVICAVLARI